MKLGGVERARQEAVDMIPPPDLSAAISSTQLSAGLCTTAHRETTAGRGGFTNRPQPSRNYN